MKACIEETKDGLVVLIPPSFVKDMRIQPNDALKLRRVGNDLVMTPVPARPVFEELVAGITDANRHPEVEWGSAVGDEVW